MEEPKTLVVSKEVWSLLHQKKFWIAKWNSEDLERAEKTKDGFIGVSGGIRCYVSQKYV